MTHDRSGHDLGDAQPPDLASAGDLSTTGHSAHDMHGDLAQPADQAGHGTHGGHGHGDDTSDVPTLVPTTWRQLILPAAILLLVLILVAGPIAGAFQPRPATPSTEQQEGGSGAGGEHEVVTTPEEMGPAATATAAPVGEATPQASPTGGAASPTTASLAPPTEATKTAVAVAGESGAVARLPVQLEVGGETFTVKAGSGLLPDWTPPESDGIATWIEGTVANHILYLPYSSNNEALFKRLKAGDSVKLVMNTGQAFFFDVTRSERAANGPPANPEQFTVTAAMAQDHAGVTLFLVGDPAPDRAVVQADFNGTIQ